MTETNSKPTSPAQDIGAESQPILGHLLEARPLIELRDHFAAAALQGMCSGEVWPREGDGAEMSRRAFLFADDMLAERMKGLDAFTVNEELLAALKETWRQIDAAGLIHLSNGVQLGATSWYVKAEDARAQSLAVIAKAEALNG